MAAENQALGVLADMAGLPPGAGGCFVSGGSAGNLSALMVARDTATHRMGDRAPDRPVIAISEEAHSSVGKALAVLGVEALLVPCEDHRLTGRGVRATLDSHPRGDDAIGVVATGGTTNAGIIDDLAGVGEVARERSLWFHVDGAYGCAALLAPSIRSRFDGIEMADSFVVDPHKWLFAPFDCAALVYREPRLAKAVHTQDASYLDVLHTDPGEWNPSDYAYHLTRRARGLPLWFSLAVNGTDAYRDAIETVLAVTQASADLIERTPYLELVREPGALGRPLPEDGLGLGHLRGLVVAATRTTRSASWCPPSGRVSQSADWPSSTRTPPSTSSRRSSPPWPEGPAARLPGPASGSWVHRSVRSGDVQGQRRRGRLLGRRGGVGDLDADRVATRPSPPCPRARRRH